MATLKFNKVDVGHGNLELGPYSTKTSVLMDKLEKELQRVGPYSTKTTVLMDKLETNFKG